MAGTKDSVTAWIEPHPPADTGAQEGILLMTVHLPALIKGRHSGGLIYFGSSYKHCQHDLADH